MAALKATRLSIEMLESRWLMASDALASALGVAATGTDEVGTAVWDAYGTQRTFNLSVPPARSPHTAELTLTNHDVGTSEFFLQINDQLWANVAHMANHVRTMPEEYPGEPVVAKAYRFLVERVHHDYRISLGDDNWYRTPTVYLNSIGFGFCGDTATALTFLWRELGYDARVWRLQGHTVSEVFADARWQMYDADLRVYYFDPDGKVAGVESLASHSDWITRPYLRIKPTDRSSFDVYSQRMADIYRTIENNYVCDECYPDPANLARDFVFQLPPQGTLQIGGHYSDRKLSLYGGDGETGWNVGQAKLTIPADWTGEIDIALALFDVIGSAEDTILINDQEFTPGSDALFQFLNGPASDRLVRISVLEHSSPIEFVYLMNPHVTALQRDNVISIQPLNSFDDVRAQIVSDDATSYRYSWRLDEPRGQTAYDSGLTASHGVIRRPDLRTFEGVEFIPQRGQYIDVSMVPAEDIFRDNRSFTIDAWVQIDASDTFRRPIFDSVRFSLLVNDQNQLVAYYRSGDQQYTVESIRAGSALTGDVWHHVAVVLRDEGAWQQFGLYVDGELVAEKQSAPISNTYRMSGPYLGMRYRPGSSEFYSGQISGVSLDTRAVSGTEIAQRAALPRSQVAIPTSDLHWSFTAARTPELAIDDRVLSDEDANRPPGSPTSQSKSPSHIVGDPALLEDGVHLNGVDQYVDITDRNTMRLLEPNQSFSVQAWFSLAEHAGARNPIVDGVAFTLMVENGYLVSYYRTEDGHWLKLRGSVPISTGEWHRATATLEAEDSRLTLRLFMDGNLVATRTGLPMSSTFPRHSFNIGRRDGGDIDTFFRGVIGDVKMWDVDIDAAAVRYSYASERRARQVA